MTPVVVRENKMVMIIAGPGTKNVYAGETSSDFPGRQTEYVEALLPEQ